MDIPAPLVENLRRLGAKLEPLKVSKRAALHYHAFAGAVYWSDELPTRLDDDEQDIVRFLLRYRMTLILAKPDDELKPYWEAGLHCFPRWIGFLPVRQAPTPEVIAFYQQRSDEVFRRFAEEANSGATIFD